MQNLGKPPLKNVLKFWALPIYREGVGGGGVREFVQSIKFIDSFSLTCLTYSCQDIQGKPTKERGEKGKTQAN